MALDVGETVRRELASELSLFGPDRLARLLGVLGDLSAELKTSTNPRLSFEIALTRMVRPDSDLTLEALAERIEALESGHSAVAHVTGGGVAAAASAAPAQAPVAAAPAPQPAAALAPGHAPAENRVATAGVAPMQAAPTPQAAPPVRQEAQPAPAPQVASPTSSQASGPAPAPAGAPTDQLKASLQNPAALQRVWQAALATLKKNKAAYGVLFLNTKAVYDADKGTLIIEFPAENSFAFKAVQKPDVQEAVSVALTQACGESLHFAYAQGGAVATASASAAVPASVPRPAPASASRPQVQQAAPAPRPAPTPAPAPRPAAVPDYDIPPYEDEAVPYDDGFVSSSPAPAPAATPAPTPGPAPVDARTSATPAPAGTQSPEELQAILAAGFGDGVRVEEVRE